MHNSGLFISYPKLLNSVLQQQSTKKLPADRRASLTGGAPVLRAPRTPELGAKSPSRRSIQALPGSGIARHRQSMHGTPGSFTTPRRNQVASPILHSSQAPVSNPFKRPTSHILRPENAFPSLQDVKAQAKSPTTKSSSSSIVRTASGTSSLMSAEGSDYSTGGDSVIINRSQQYNESEYNGGSSSAAIAQAVAMAVSQVQADAQKQILELKQQLESSQNESSERGIQLQEQTGLLRDLETTVVEFQNLKEAEEAEREAVAAMGGNGENQQNSKAIEELKQSHTKELDERDRKISSLKTQLDERRADFRSTLDDLQADMRDSNAAYVREIHSLQTKLMDAEKVRERVQELEQLVQEFETGGSSSNKIVADQDAKAQITKLAELENKLLEKDEKLNDMREQLEQAQQRLSDMSMVAAASSPFSSPFSNRNSGGDGNILDEIGGSGRDSGIFGSEKLKQQLKSERAQRIQLENEISNLEAVIEEKVFKEEEMERELEILRNQNNELQSAGPYLNQVQQKRKSSGIPPQPHATPLASNSTQDTFGTDSTDSLLETPSIESPMAIAISGTAISPETFGDAANTLSVGNGKTLKEQQGGPHAITTKTPSPEFKAATETVVPIYTSPKKIDLAGGRDKWCGLCEREGHESIECPYEEEF